MPSQEGTAMKSRLALLVVIFALLFATHRGTFSSQNSAERLGVIDGDTLQVDGAIVQLYGIDAPELGQLCESEGRLLPCGLNAALALDKLVSLNRSSLYCSPWSQGGRSAQDPPPGTAVHVCEVGDQDLAVLMLHSGYGLAVPGAFPDYLDAEREAREARLGIWQSDFVAPWDWRTGVRSPERRSDSTRDCKVKGVLSADGRRVYYVPTDAEYRAISMDSTRGDTMFCSDEDARRAGWRHLGETAGVTR
jgi:endonuclease YncB( thermonuclease family)